MCEGCAYYVDNWFYGYQVYCTHPTEYWVNVLGWIVIFLIFSFGFIMFINKLKVKIEKKVKE